ncbi:efflux RND transporter periplasmic adaptor subunit [Patescibacteria group bacterium]|nr:efflux RND transporter periplasmic adaptor subunit [Patescibacteria group bacterium]MBU1721355.1 efflux RND transporter periplasmic adaptor subunit [Patescibacteria group bacterium]MBU1901563.1 efflux RND transporter periplasmic adaptor subunit [Patescibacteria group bacterium]
METQLPNSIKKTPWYKKKMPYIVVIFLFIIASIVFAQYKKGVQAPTYEILPVEIGNIIQTVDATGSVESAQEIDLQFETIGTVKTVDKQANDIVKAGDIIATLDTKNIDAQIAQAQANVSRAYADLQTLRAGSTDAQIQSYIAARDKTKADLAQIQLTNDKAIQNAQAAVDTAQNNLQQSQAGVTSQIIQDAYDDLAALLYTVQNDVAKALTEADNILGIDNTLANDEYDNILGALNGTSVTQAKTNYYQTKQKKQAFDLVVNDMSAVSTHASIDSSATQAKEALQSARELLFSVAAVLDSTVPVGTLSQAELDVLKTGVETMRTSIATDIVSLTNSIQGIETANYTVASYDIAYEKAVEDLKHAKQKALIDIDAYTAILHQAEANLAQAKNPPRQSEVAVYQAALASAQASVAQVQASKEQSILRAPIDGMIGKIDIKQGEYVTSQRLAAKLVNPDFQITVDIPETDITKISKGDKASITLDAFGDGIELSAITDQIEQGETVIQDVIYYTVTLHIEDTLGKELLNGMTADVVFYTEEKNNVIAIPQRVIKTNGIGKYVRILRNNVVEEIPVTLGLRGDGGLVEIVSGLTEGMNLIVKEIEE